MKKVRIIPRLDIKNNTVVKGIHLEGLRVVGVPDELAYKYYQEGADELLYIDAVASLYERNSLHNIISKAAEKIFIPLTVGGGIRTLQDIEYILNSGADKVAINTAAVKRPEFIKEAANKYGAQCIVLSVQAKQNKHNKWEVYTETGRERSGKDVLEWIQLSVQLGAGEILLTSVDRDGTKKGFDIDLCSKIAESIKVPLIISSGAGKVEDIIKVIDIVSPDAVAVGSILHYRICSIAEIKMNMWKAKIPVRQ
jgi:imidazole glycerol-phosphate synthase subunit HisF